MSRVPQLWEIWHARFEAEQAILAELDYGRRVAEEENALSTDEIRAAFAVRFERETE